MALIAITFDERICSIQNVIGLQTGTRMSSINKGNCLMTKAQAGSGCAACCQVIASICRAIVRAPNSVMTLHSARLVFHRFGL